jgi:hypothetical protein
MQPFRQPARHFFKPVVMTRILFALLCCLPAALSAQRHAFNTEPFAALEVFGPFDVELVQADVHRIEIDYRGVSPDDVVVGVRKGALRLKLRNRFYLSEWIPGNWESQIRVKIYCTGIDEVKAQAGALVAAVGRLESKSMVVESSMGAEVSLDIRAEDVQVRANTGGVVRLGGDAGHADIKSTMGGVVKARRLQSRTASVYASMGGEVSVLVLDELNVNASFGSVVDYTGSPDVRYFRSDFGAAVTKDRRQ